jgi:tetratricopeptide (TPR) repeat protein
MTNKQKRQTFWQQNHATIISGILATIIASLVLNVSGAFGNFFASLYATLGVYDYYASLDIATGLLMVAGGLALRRMITMRRHGLSKKQGEAGKKQSKPTIYTGKKTYPVIVAAIILLMCGGLTFNIYHRLHDPKQFVIVVAQFAGSNPEEHMIPQRLEKLFRDQHRDDIIVKLTPKVITSDDEAERVGRQNRAAAVVYGFYHNDTPQEVVAYAHLTHDVVVSRAVSLSRTEERVMTGTVDSRITTQKDTLPFGMAVNQTNSGIAQLGLFLCGIQQLNHTQYAAAAGSFDDALNQSESHQHLSADTLRYFRALANHARDQFDSAKDDFETVLASSNKLSTQIQANANHALGDIAYIRKQYQNADLRYSKAIGLNHNDLDAYTNRGFARDDLNRPDEALADFDKAIALSRTYAKRYAYPYNGRGVVFWQQKNYDRALQEFDKAIKIDKKYVDPIVNKAQVLADKKDFTGSMQLFDKALKLNPKSAVTYYNRGTVQDLQRKRDAAIADYAQAIKYDSKYTKAYNNRAALYSEKEDYDKSIADFDAAIRLEPENGSLYHNRAGALYSKGAPLYVDEATTKQGYDIIVKADDDIDKAIQLRPDIAAGYAIRGQIFMLLGGEKFYDNALAEFNKAVARDDRNAKVYKARGLIYESKEQYAEAAANYERGKSIDPKDPDYYYAEGRSYIRSNNYDKALAAYNKAVALAPDKPDPYLLRAMFYLGQKDKDKAKADARKVIELDKGGKKTATAKAILEL